MASFTETIEVTRALDEAFAYVADFRTAEEWDPGIVSSRATTDGAPRVGSTYDVVAEFRGREVPFRYEIRELDPGRRLVIHGEGEKATSDDTITFETVENGGTRVVYTADLRMKGVLRVAEPFLGGTFAEMGRKALAGLRQQLDAGATPPV